MTTWAITQTKPSLGGVLVSVPGPMLNGDFSLPIEQGATLATKSIQVTGTPGVGFNLRYEESNDGTSWFLNLNAITTVGITTVTSPSRFARLAITAGDGTTSVSVLVFLTPQRGS